MRAVLIQHPDSHCDAVSRIEVDVACPQPDLLVLRYVLIGSMDRLVLPAIVEPARKDGLWQHTCFEAFLRADPGDAYYEFNFAPSRQWAAYCFESRRSGMREAGGVEPEIIVRRRDAEFELQVSLKFTSLPANAAWHLGLSAVIEGASGHMSYWALMHPPGKPDFHDANAFAVQLVAQAR